MYFVMTVDPQATKALKINVKEKGFESEEPFVMSCDFDETTECTDLVIGKRLIQNVFCFSNELKELVDYYEEDYRATPFFIVDKKQEQQKVYWHVEVPLVDCLLEERNRHYTKLTVLKEKLTNAALFAVAFEKQTYLIASLELAEGILNNHLLGVLFTPVTIKEGEQ